LVACDEIGDSWVGSPGASEFVNFVVTVRFQVFFSAFLARNSLKLW